jgi:hypothetical protein
MTARSRSATAVLDFAFEHDLVGKPVSTFPDHAPDESPVVRHAGKETVSNWRFESKTDANLRNSIIDD